MKYCFNLNIRSMCFYERLTDKSFFSIETEEDMLYLIYAVFVVSNHERIDFAAFCSMLENPKVMKELTRQYEQYIRFNQQFEFKTQKTQDNSKEKSGELPKITELVEFAVSVIGLDPRYVMEDMELWELDNYISTYFKHKEGEDKERLIENRLWTFLTMSPHINLKKIKKPEDLLPFEFEKEEKEKSAKEKLKMQVAGVRRLAKLREEKKDG